MRKHILHLTVVHAITEISRKGEEEGLYALFILQTERNSL